MPDYSITRPDSVEWDAFVANHPDSHILQASDWGRLKSQFGWSADLVGIQDEAGAIVAGALMLFRALPLRLGTLAYIPAGPLFHCSAPDSPDHPTNQLLWTAIHRTARQNRAAFLKVEPCNWYRPRPDLPAQLAYAGLRVSPQTIQPPRTVVLNLPRNEDMILKRMNQSTRRKVKFGPKKQIAVREGTAEDIASFNSLISVTGQRDGFGVHAPDYYQLAFDLFSKEERCVLLMASYAGHDLAGIMVFRSGENAYYLYGASSNEERNRMPTYVVQWEAIQWAMRHGAIRYDLWGVPDAEPEVLEAPYQKSADKSDDTENKEAVAAEPEHRGSLWGVYGFKRGFGGQIVRSVGAWDKVYNPLLYAAYSWYVRRRGAD